MSVFDPFVSHRFSSKLDSIDESEPGLKRNSSSNMAGELKEEENPNIMVYKKMETLLELMQDPTSGIVVKTVKSFISKIPSVFTGSDLITWILKNLDVDDTAEALHLANLLGTYGYIFPIDDHVLSVKNDGTYYRFQTPCFWPSKCTEPENTDYAVYLCKRTMQNKQRLELVDYEAENLARLQKMFSRKWEFIFIQAEAQAKVDKKRDKLERKVLDSQERAFWDVHRPAPGCVNTTEVDIKKTCRNIKRHKITNKVLNTLPESGGPSSTEAEKLSAIDYLEKEVERLRRLGERRRVKVSKVAESYISYYEQYSELDPFTSPAEPSNPWLSDNIDFWEQENSMKDIPQRRVKRWGFSVREILKDNCGREHFRKFLEKEFSAENLKFWEACQRLKGISQRMVADAVQDIYTEYLSPSAHDPVNVDCKVAETVRKKITQNPDRYCFEEAEEHIYQLMKNDCYNRYLRSDMYKEFLSGTKKKSKRCFATEVRRLRDLTKTQGFVNLMHQQQQQHGSSPRTTMQQVVQAIREASNLGKLQEQQKQPNGSNSNATTMTSKAATTAANIGTSATASNESGSYTANNDTFGKEENNIGQLSINTNSRLKLHVPLPSPPKTDAKYTGSNQKDQLGTAISINATPKDQKFNTPPVAADSSSGSENSTSATSGNAGDGAAKNVSESQQGTSETPLFQQEELKSSLENQTQGQNKKNTTNSNTGVTSKQSDSASACSPWNCLESAKNDESWKGRKRGHSSAVENEAK